MHLCLGIQETIYLFFFITLRCIQAKTNEQFLPMSQYELTHRKRLREHKLMSKVERVDNFNNLCNFQHLANNNIFTTDNWNCYVISIFRVILIAWSENERDMLMKMYKQRLAYSGRLHPLSVCQRCWFLRTEGKRRTRKNPLIWRRREGLSPGHHGGRRVLSSLRQ